MRSSPTSRADRPSGPFPAPPGPWPGLAAADALAARSLAFLADAAARLGVPAPLAPERARDVLLERAAVMGHTPPGRTSCGGAARLLPAADAWVAVNLPRPDDCELLPAWLPGLAPGRPGTDAVARGTRPGEPAAGAVPWDAVEAAVATRSADEVVDRAQLLGLAVASVPPPLGRLAARPAVDEQLSARGTADPARTHLATPSGTPVAPGRHPSEVTVVDLSSLWAGPLCGWLLGRLGASVVKVESSTRPDGARIGSPAFHHRLNGTKDRRSLPLAGAEGRRALRALLDGADVVVEGSRPRALEQMGIDPVEWASDRPGRVWVSLTAYGRTGPWRNRVGFGDDAAAAGGLVRRDREGRPAFVGDAVADPLAGLVAAAAAADALAEGGGVLVDVALREVARSAAAGADLAASA